MHVRPIAFDLEHVDDLRRTVVAEQLTERLFVIRDAVFFHQLDEILRGVAGEGGAAEMRIFRQVVFRLGVQVGEVAASATGDADLFAEPVIVLDQQRRFPALAGFSRAHHAGGAGTDDDNVEFALQRNALWRKQFTR